MNKKVPILIATPYLLRQRTQHPLKVTCLVQWITKIKEKLHVAYPTKYSAFIQKYLVSEGEWRQFWSQNSKITWRSLELVVPTWVRVTYLPNLEKFSRFFSPKGDSNWSVNKLIHFTDQFCQWAYNYLFCVK